MAASSCTECNQTPNAKVSMFSSQCMGDNVHTQKEKNPDRQLRSHNICLVGKDVELSKQLGGWLRSSHPLKSA